MPTRNVVLTDHQARLVERLVVSGRYQNASEVLREGIRLVERQEAAYAAGLRALREAGVADIDAGDFRSFEALKPLRNHLDVLSRMLHDRMDLPSAEVE